MHIIHIASEFAPCVKVGGLADVVLGLCRELSYNGHKIEVIIPKYECIEKKNIIGLEPSKLKISTFYDNKRIESRVWKGKLLELPITLIEPLHPDNYFQRPECYGYKDDVLRFSCFCQVVLEYMKLEKKNPDIIHLHDWQTALIAPMSKDLFKSSSFSSSRITFTIHNIEHQGWCSKKDLDKVGLDGTHYLHPSRLQDNIRSWDINMMKGALVYADHINTVSPTYAYEVKTHEGGKGLENTLKKYEDKFSGILNGIDAESWNPENDPAIPFHYSWRNIEEKKKNTEALRDILSLSKENKPIVACISRLVPQKGVELIKHAIFRTLDSGGQFVLLGSSPIKKIQDDFLKIKKQFQKHPQVSLEFGFKEDLAHLIFAGADIFIVPSIFEPCGLTQLIALKYGSIPVVRKTGGLADTIFDIEYSEKPFEKGNGYVFEHPNKQGLNFALDRAIKHWRQKPSEWKELMLRGMRIDSSWKEPAKRYVKIYEKGKKTLVSTI